MLVKAIATALVLLATKADAFIANNTTNLPLATTRLYQTNQISNDADSDKTNNNDITTGVPKLPDILELQGALDSETPEMKRLQTCENDKFLYEILGKACHDELEVLSRMGLISKLPVETLQEAIIRAREDLRRPKEPNTIVELALYALKYIKSLFNGQTYAKPRDFSLIAKHYHDRIISHGGRVKIPTKYNLNAAPEIEICNPAISDSIFLSNAAVLGYAGPEMYKQLEELPTEILEKVLLVMNNIYKNPMLHSQHVLSQKACAYGWSADSDGLVWKDYTTLWLAKKQSLIAFMRYYPKDIFPTTIPGYLLLHELFTLGTSDERDLATTYCRDMVKSRNFLNKIYSDSLLVKCTISGTIGYIAGQICRKLANYFADNIFGTDSGVGLIIKSKLDPDLLAYALPVVSIIKSLKGNAENLGRGNEEKFAELMNLMEQSLRVDMGKPEQLEQAILTLRNKLPSLQRKLSLNSNDLIAYTLLNMIYLQMLPGLQIGIISGRLLESQKLYKPLERSYLLTLLHLLRLVPLQGECDTEPIETELPAVTDEYHRALPLPREVYFPCLSREAEHLKVYANKRFNETRLECWKTLKMNLEIDKAFIALADRLDTSRWFIFDFASKATVAAFVAAVTRDVYDIVQLLYNDLQIDPTFDTLNGDKEDSNKDGNTVVDKRTAKENVIHTHFSDVLGVYRTEEQMGTDGPLKLPRNERIYDTVAAILECGSDWTRIHHNYLRYPMPRIESSNSTISENTKILSKNDNITTDLTKKLPLVDAKQISAKWDKLATLYGLRDRVVYSNILRAFREITLLKEYQIECVGSTFQIYNLSDIVSDEMRAVVDRYGKDGKVKSSDLPSPIARHLRLLTLASYMGIGEVDALDWSRCLDYPRFRDQLSDILDDLFDQAAITPYKPSAIDSDVLDTLSNSTSRGVVGHDNIYRLLLDPGVWTREDYSSFPTDRVGNDDFISEKELSGVTGELRKFSSRPADIKFHSTVSDMSGNTDKNVTDSSTIGIHTNNVSDPLLGEKENFESNPQCKSNTLSTQLFTNIIPKIDNLLGEHYPGRLMFVNTLVQLLRSRVIVLKKAMKASRDMRDPYLSSQHINCLLNVRQTLKMLCHYYDLPMRYRIKNALLDNFHPHNPPDLTPSIHSDTMATASRDIDLDDPPPPPTLQELANRKYFREMKKLLTTKIYHHDSKIPYFEQQKQLKRLKEGKEMDENFKFDPDHIFVGREKHDQPIYNVDSDDESNATPNDEIADKIYPLGFGKAAALDKIYKSPILSPSDEFYLAVAYTLVYPQQADKLPLVLKMLGNTDQLVRIEAAKSYLRKSLATFSDYDLSKFNISEYETWVANQVYEETCLVAGGVNLTEHLDNPAGCNDGIYQPWKPQVSNRLEHYYATKEPDNMQHLDKAAAYLKVSAHDRSMIHDKVFWRVYLNAPHAMKSQISSKLGLTTSVTNVVDLELQYKDFHNNYFCEAKALIGDPGKLVEACHNMLAKMEKLGVLRKDGSPKFSLSGTDNFEFYQAYILALIELNMEFENVEKLGNVLGYFGKDLVDQLQNIGTKMYLKYLKDHFGTKLEKDCLKPLEKYNRLFQLSHDDLENIVKIHRTNLVFDEYSPESGWDDLVRVKEIVEPGCIGEYFGLDNTRSQQWLINILNESVGEYGLSDFIRFNGHGGLASDRAYDWHNGNALESRIAMALDTLVMDKDHLLDSALEIAIEANNYIHQCIEQAGRMNFVEACQELSVTLKRLSLLNNSQFRDVQKYLRTETSHRPLLDVLQYLKSELDDRDMARCKELIVGCVPINCAR